MLLVVVIFLLPFLLPVIHITNVSICVMSEVHLRIKGLPIVKHCFVVLLLFAIAGCDGHPIFSPNREGFPPWEKYPDGKGVTYVNKYTHDPGIDPTYLASFRYDDAASLDRYVQAFGLVPLADGEDASTFTTTIPDEIPWFPLANVTERYVYPDKEAEYVANIWVESAKNVAIIERSWW